MVSCSKCGKEKTGKQGKYKICKPCRAEYVRDYRTSHPDQHKIQGWNEPNYHQNLRDEVLKLLGGKCAWTDCTWVDPRALQIDHKQGGGWLDVKGQTLLRKILKLNGEGFQLLCANHNWIKRVERREIRGSLSK